MPSAEASIAPVANQPLAPLTTLGIGGPAEWYVRAADVGQVAAAHRWAAARRLPVLVLGGGSNLVVADTGVRGLVLHVGVTGAAFDAHGDHAVVRSGAGEHWDRLVAQVVAAGYAGLECLSGIPGLVGGTPLQNVGAYGQEVADTIHHVTAYDVRTGDTVDIPARDCGFSYRQSRFKGADAGRFVICGVTFEVRRGAPTVTYPDVMAWVEQNGLRQPAVGDIRRGVLEIRRRKGMVLDPADPDTRSVGSFFMNPIVSASARDALGAPAFALPGGQVKIPAAWLIERAGFGRGFTAGAAGVSTKHPLALVNRGGASADEIVNLACEIKRAVLQRFGIALRPEPVFAGFAADERVQFLQKATSDWRHS